MPAYKSANGTWYTKFYTKDWQGNQKQILKRGFRTKKDAQAYEHDFKAKNTALPSMSLQTLSNEFLQDYRVNHRNNSYLIAEANLRLHILPLLGEVLLDSLTPIKLRKWQLKTIKKGWANSTLSSIQNTMKQLLKYGIKFYHLPATIINLESMGKVEKRIVFIELKTWQKIDKLIANKHDKALFNLMFWSGIRIGEAMGLQPADFDFKKNTIHITKQLDYKTGTLSPLKTTSSKRVITMPKKVMQLVKDYFKNYHTIPALPFAVKSTMTIRRYFKEYCTRAGVEGINIHALRHSHASLLIKQGIPINAISKRLGHSNPSITLRVYSHVYEEADSDIAKMLEKIK